MGDEWAIELQPEYTTMSLKPAIGRDWFDTYQNDCYPSDYITNQGKKYRVPKYYDNVTKKRNPEKMEAIKEERVARANKRLSDTTPRRLAAREQVQLAKLKTLRRNYEGQ